MVDSPTHDTSTTGSKGIFVSLNFAMTIYASLKINKNKTQNKIMSASLALHPPVTRTSTSTAIPLPMQSAIRFASDYSAMTSTEAIISGFSKQEMQSDIT